MYPILYKQGEKDFTHLGLGVLTDAISCIVEETRNGIFELEMEYPVGGLHYQELIEDRLLKVDAGHKLKEQRFKIIRILRGKHKIKVFAEHISYKALNCNIRPFVSTGRVNAQEALKIWRDNQVEPNDMEVYSDISTIASTEWSIEEMENARQALGGKRGSILDVWGGEYEFDNNKISLWRNRGKDSQTLISYGRNIIDIEQEKRIDNTFTSVYPYAVFEGQGESKEVVTLPEFFVDSEYAGNFSNRNILTLNLSDKFKNKPTVAQLRARAKSYIKSNNIGIPNVSIKLNIQDLSKTIEYADLKDIEALNLCDRAIVRFEKLGIDTEAKVVGVKWNVLKEEYNQLMLGSTKRTIGDVINNVIDRQIDESEDKITQIAYRAANNANIVHKGQEEPKSPKSGDLWYKQNGKHTEMYIYNGDLWELKVSTEWLEDAGRLTIGTIDAAQINVINLDAANITTGSLRGGNVEIDLDQGTFLIGPNTENYQMWYDGNNFKMRSKLIEKKHLTDELTGELEEKVTTHNFEVSNNQLKSEISGVDKNNNEKISKLIQTINGLNLMMTGTNETLITHSTSGEVTVDESKIVPKIPNLITDKVEKENIKQDKLDIDAIYNVIVNNGDLKGTAVTDLMRAYDLYYKYSNELINKSENITSTEKYNYKVYSSDLIKALERARKYIEDYKNSKIVEQYKADINATKEAFTSEYQKITTQVSGVNGRVNTLSTDVSRIKQKADSIEVVVEGKLKSMRDHISMIQQTADRIDITVAEKVGRDTIISSINQSASNIKIKASLIDLDGYVQATQLSTGGYSLNRNNSQLSQITGSTVKTDKGSVNYIHMQNQNIRFYNNNLQKMLLGFVAQDGTSTQFPYILMGAGDHNGGDRFQISKWVNAATLEYRIPSSTSWRMTQQIRFQREGIYLTDKNFNLKNISNMLYHTQIFNNSLNIAPNDGNGKCWSFESEGTYYKSSTRGEWKNLSRMFDGYKSYSNSFELNSPNGNCGLEIRNTGIFVKFPDSSGWYSLSTLLGM